MTEKTPFEIEWEKDRESKEEFETLSEWIRKYYPNDIPTEKVKEFISKLKEIVLKGLPTLTTCKKINNLAGKELSDSPLKSSSVLEDKELEEIETETQVVNDRINSSGSDDVKKAYKKGQKDLYNYYFKDFKNPMITERVGSDDVCEEIIKTIEKRKGKSNIGTLTRIYSYCKQLKKKDDVCKCGKPKGPNCWASAMCHDPSHWCQCKQFKKKDDEE